MVWVADVSQESEKVSIPEYIVRGMLSMMLGFTCGHFVMYLMRL